MNSNEALYRRHGALVDIKYERGLTDDEARELEEIREQLSVIEQPFYDRIMAELDRRFGKLATAPDGEE